MISRRRIFIGLVITALVLQAGAAWAVKYSFTSFDGLPYDINNSGEIVGEYRVGERIYGFLKVGPKYTTIDYPGASALETRASGINDSGQIVGDYYDGQNPYSFLKIGDTYTTLVAPGKPLYGVRATDINNLGHIVGDDFLLIYGFLKVGDTYTTFHSPLGAQPDFQVWDVNDADQIVGLFTGPPENMEHGFLKVGSIFSPIDPPDSQQTEAHGINNAGQIVGFYFDSDGKSHGFLRVGSQYTSIDYPGAIATQAYGINDFGQIVGRYWEGSYSNDHGFLATPIPSPLPSSLLFLGSGLVGLLGCWRLRKR